IYHSLKPAIHLYSIPSICPNTVLFLPIQVEKSSTSIHLKFQSALAVGESDLLPPLQVLFDLPLQLLFDPPLQLLFDPPLQLLFDSPQQLLFDSPLQLLFDSPLQLLFDPPIPFSTLRISDLLLSWQGLDLVESFELPTTLAKGPTKYWGHELPEFGLGGNPTFPSRYAIFHRFSTLSPVFSFPCSKISILEDI
ncbi:hypothetical protein AVEN_248850-1, partial [Araneus ventricosus]